MILISGCSKVEEPAAATGKAVADVPAVEPPKEPAKTYEFSIVNKYRDETSALCMITSRVKNIDGITHRYHLNSYIIINGAKEALEEEFNLDAGSLRVFTRNFECPDGSEYTLNSEISQLK